MHAYDAVDVDDNVSYCLSPFGIFCFCFFAAFSSPHVPCTYVKRNETKSQMSLDRTRQKKKKSGQVES